MMKFLKYIWQLPLNLMGLIYGYFYISEWIYSRDNYDLYVHTNKNNITLGRHIFISSRAGMKEVDEEIKNIERSIKWGPLYLFVFIIPQLIKELLAKKC